MDEIHSPATQRRRFGAAQSAQRRQRSAAYNGGGSGRAAASARRQRSMLAASTSVDSLDYESDGGLGPNSSPGGSPSKGYYGGGGRRDDEVEVGSSTPSPTKSRKTVAFSGERNFAPKVIYTEHWNGCSPLCRRT